MLITSQDAWHCCYDDEHAQKIVLKYNGKPVESLWVDLSRYWWKIGFDVSKKQVLTLFGVSPSTVSKLKAAFHIMGIVRHVAQWASEGHIMKTSGDCAPRPVRLTWQEKKKKSVCWNATCQCTWFRTYSTNPNVTANRWIFLFHFS